MISNYFLEKVKELALSNGYISLHSSDPGKNGSSEISGGSYSRQKFSESDLDFQVPTCSVGFVGIWDSVSGGNFLWGSDPMGSTSLRAGDIYRVLTSSLKISV